MISLKKYLEAPAQFGQEQGISEPNDVFTVAMDAYGAALAEMGNCSVEACPGLGDGLKRKLCECRTGLSTSMRVEALTETDHRTREALCNWGHEAAGHMREKACEVKELLLAVARTAESVSARDQKSATQMSQVTTRLKAIASLEDLTEIRMEIEKSAADLKISIDRMAEEGKAALDRLRDQVTSYQARLEEAELIASRDTLTGLGSRHYVESQMGQRMTADALFCVALIDIDGFKKVNDVYGHGTGDELLKKFAIELRSACRTTDAVGRWGGDEFVVLFDCGLEEAESRAERMMKWICGNYVVRGRAGELKLQVSASMGLAAREAGEEMKDLLARADASMYTRKAASRTGAA